MTELTQNYSNEAEQALLGCILIDPDLINTLDLNPDEFGLLRHRQIWNGFETVHRQGKSIDAVTVCEYLKQIGKLDEIGGSAYIIEILASVPTSMNAESYVAIVREKAKRRNLTRIATDIARLAGDETRPVDAETPVFIQRLADTAHVKNGAVHISEVMSKLYDEVEYRSKNPQVVWGIQTGIPTFDEITGGLQRGELMILSGEPGVGKSILAMQMAGAMGEKAPGAVYSMEMGSLQVARRLVSGKASIPTRNLKTGKDIDWTAFTEAVEHFSKLPIYISESTGWTTTSIRADMARLKAQNGIEWFVLDYLYLLMDGASFADEIERTALASKGMKRLTKELNLAGIAVHSMNKSGMETSKERQTTSGGIPTMGNLRGSGQVVYDADLIVFITKYKAEIDTLFNATPQNERDNVRVLWFGKGRELENPKKFIKLVKHPGFPAFRECTK